MLIDGGKLMAEQLGIHKTTEVAFPDGRRTTLHPVRYVPTLANPRMRLSLDGEWRLTRWPFRAKEAVLAASKTSDRKWASVIQPGKVFYWDPEKTVEGIANWNRVGLDHIHPEDGAVIRRTATLPSAWKGKRIFLRFDSIYPAGRVYLNGKLLGEHTSGLTPAEWDVTGIATAGRLALVAVRILRKHKFVKMDMPRHGCEFAGLAQSACFFAVEPCHVSECHVAASVDPSLKSGRLSGVVTLCNPTSKSVSGRVAVVLVDPVGKKAAECDVELFCDDADVCSIPVDLKVPRPQLWNDEFPRLYTVKLTLTIRRQKDQEITWRCGFRRFELAGQRPVLNGKPVKFRGVNHLTYHPEFGLHTPEEWLRKNLTLMKKANVNAIRTHYLGPRCLADLCDELGLYLLQELPIDWGTNYIHDPEWVGPGLQRIAGGILRDRHHASVMVWSVGNENMPESAAVADDGWNHLRIYDRFAKKLDPTRPTMFPPPGPANKIRGIFEVRVGDMGDTHYSFNLARDFMKTGAVTNPRAWTGEMESTTREDAVARGWSGVWFSSEYGIMNMMPDLLNAPYGSIIDDVKEDPKSGRNSQQVFIDRLRREWGLLRHEPTCLGGAYFPWICAGTGNNPWGWVAWAEDNDWGVVTADLTAKPFFWGLRVLFSPVWFPEKVAWQEGQTEICFSVTNQYNAIDLKDCTLRTLMHWGYGPGAMRWKDIRVECPPGETREIVIPIWNPTTLEALKKGVTTVCRCSLIDPRGFRPITADILMVPGMEKEAPRALAVGPDAVL